MGLSFNDTIPNHLSLEGSYNGVRCWYVAFASQFSTGLVREIPSNGMENRTSHDELIAPHLKQYLTRRSLGLIFSMRDFRVFSDLELWAIFKEIGNGCLEFAYHESDGQFKMAAYAQVGLANIAGFDVADDSIYRKKLRYSRLAPYFKRT